MKLVFKATKAGVRSALKTKTSRKVWEVAPGKCTADQGINDFSPKKSELACYIPWRSAVAMGDEKFKKTLPGSDFR